jgi:hypothetical protein
MKLYGNLRSSILNPSNLVSAVLSLETGRAICMAQRLMAADGPNCFGSPCGTVFQLTPAPAGPWTHTVLYSFNGGTDGGHPGRALTLDATGNLYGTTGIGGDPNCTGGNGDGCGTVFQLALSAVPGGAWTETILHRFTGGRDGAGPGGLTFGKEGLLYGPAGAGANNDGLVFSVTP